MIAAGVWSDAVAGIPDEARVPVRPVKGQIMRLHDPAGPGLLTRVLRIQGGVYVVPRGDGRYVLGATMEERGFDTTVTAGPLFELLRDAIELLPGLSELVIDELIAGLRPATPDNAPAIGPGSLRGLHWATGHYRHGILLTPDHRRDRRRGAARRRPAGAPFSPIRFAAARWCDADQPSTARTAQLPDGATVATIVALLERRARRAWRRRRGRRRGRRRAAGGTRTRLAEGARGRGRRGGSGRMRA